MKAKPPKFRPEAEPLAAIKVSVPISLLESINHARGDIPLSSYCRDVLAHRMMPDPSVAAAQKVVRTAASLEQLIATLRDKVDNSEQLSPYDADVLFSLSQMANGVQDLSADCHRLIHAVATAQLARAGYRRTGP